MWIGLLKVSGHSMAPRYQDGDFVLVSEIPMVFRGVKPGDVIVLNQPAYGTLLKQVERLDPESGEIFVVGSAPESVDSRQFGGIPREALLGKVIGHLKARINKLA